MSKHSTQRLQGPGAAQARTAWTGAEEGFLPRFPALDENIQGGVCVVGAGVSGLAVGLELAERGRDVVLVEARGLACGQTARSSAHLVTALDERYFVLEHRHGVETARAAADAHARAIAWIRRAVDRYHIDCGWEDVRGLLAVPESLAVRAEGLLIAEREAAARAGVACVEAGVREGIPAAFRPFGLLFPGQAQVDPVRLLAGLAGAFVRCGGRLFCGTPVRTIRRRRGLEVLTTAAGLRIGARDVVLATHELPASLAAGMRRLRPRVSFVLGFEWPGDDRFLLWDGYWDGPTPYHYVRTVGRRPDGPAGAMLLVGGEDEAGMTPADPAGTYARLEAWTRRCFPAAGARRWAWWGRIQEPDGEFALIGRTPGRPRVSVVAGDSGNGMTYAAIAAVRLADQLDGFPAPEVQDLMYGPASRG